MRKMTKQQIPVLILFLQVLFGSSLLAQTCVGLSATYAVVESRCVATGSITVTATGGSGNYEYKVTGPIVTALTPSNIITGLSAGNYLVTIHDITNNCTYQSGIVTVPGNYVDPNFNMTVTQTSCANTADGSITVTAQQFGRTPFSYKIIAPSASGVGTVSATGVFNNLVSGTYSIQLSDSCGALQTRSVDVPAFGWKILNSFISKICDTISVSLTLKDDNGILSPNPVFNGFVYGILRGPGDTVWYNNSSFLYTLNHDRKVTVIVKDLCGKTRELVWNDTAIPALDPVAVTTNFACSTFTAFVAGAVNFSASTQFCLFNSSNVQLSCNTTGLFNNIPYGSYCIKAIDPCYDTVITRCFTAAKLIPAVDTLLLITSTCAGATVSVTGQVNLSNPNYCLFNNVTNTLITCNNSGVFNVPFGNYCIKINNDPVCYDTIITRCFVIAKPAPAVSILNLTCTSFTASVPVTTGLSNPQFCLYNASNVLIACNSIGTFDNLPFGSYCMNIINNPFCFDTTFTLCFTVLQPVPDVGAVNIKNVTCTFTATVTGQTGLSNPQFCLYNNNNQLVSCNTTGVFDFVPLGSYCIKMFNDPACLDTVITRCFSEFGEPVDFTATSSPSCILIGGTDIIVNITSGKSNYNVSVYAPSGLSIASGFTAGNNKNLTLTGIPSLPAGIPYKIIVTDLCGTKDSLFISPSYSILQRKKTITPKCPSGPEPNGSADFVLDVTNNNIGGNIKPKITKKDGVTVSISGNSGGNKYLTTFTGLGPGTYIVTTNIANCNVDVFDTIVVKTYLFPGLQKSAAYTCDNGTVSIGQAVTGGVPPFTYEIIASTPAVPSIIAPPQANPIFTINNGTSYSLIRLRATDACSNAGLNDVGVLPLTVAKSIQGTDCFFNGLTLRVDTIPNATYKWYRKTSLVDSVLVGTDITYELPYVTQIDTGRYVCVININNGCLARQANFTVTGSCGGAILPATITLNGRLQNGKAELSWLANQDESIKAFELEKSNSANFGYHPVKKIVTENVSQNKFTVIDPEQLAADNYYRLKSIYLNDAVKYSNVVLIKAGEENISVKPNPAADRLVVSLQGKTKTDYLITITSLLGQMIYSKQFNNIQSQDVMVQRDRNRVKPGIYLVVVNNLNTHTRITEKVIFD